MNAKRRITGAVCALLLGTLLFATNHAAASAPVHIDVVHVDVVNDSTASAMRAALQGNPDLLVLEIDSSGGTETALNSMLNLIATTKIPVVAEVPDGAQAQDGGLILAEGTDYFSAANSARIGAPRPMNASRNPGSVASSLASLKGRDSVWVYRALNSGLQMTGGQAMQQQVSDGNAATTAALLAELNGKQVNGHLVNTKGVAVSVVSPTGWDGLINSLATPDVAFLLLMIALSFFILWGAHPGNIAVMFGAVAAAVFAALSFSDLPIQPIGIALAIAACVVLVVDLFNPTHGILTAAGATLMVLAGWQLVDTSVLSDGVNVVLIAVTVLTVCGTYAFLAPRLLAVRRMPVTNQWIGSRATVTQDLDPDGMVSLQGALWRATSESGIAPAGQSVEVTGVNGLRLTVKKRL